VASDKSEKNGKEVRLSALDRSIQTAIGDGRTVGDDDDPGKTKYPALWEWLSRIYIGLDRVRTPATITISLGPSGVLVNVNDRDLCVNCGSTCLHLDDAFMSLERALTSSVPPIRSYGKKEPRLRKKSSG